MSDTHDYLVEPDSKVKLSKYDPEDRGDFDEKEDAEKQTGELLEELQELQGLLYAEGKRALLVVFQAMDAGGKDGAIRTVFSGVNPQGCAVHSFKKPTDEEMQHDFIWRCHMHCPGKGMIGIFNRSHYESVLIERIAEVVPEKVWKKRYGHINDFEQMLTEEGTVVRKFYLHISKDEQRERLQERLSDPAKNWKFASSDLEVRQQWDDYIAAYEDVLSKTSTRHAPWYVIPANKKWYRNYLIAGVLVRTLKELDMKYPPAEKGLDRVVVR